MSAAAAPRCLSDLPDDLLQHILFLAPVRDAASAGVLSRRWRSLWRSSGTVYLDSRSLHRYTYQDKRRRLPSPPWNGVSAKDHLVDASEKALTAATTVPITRLTFIVKKPGPEPGDTRAHRRPDTPEHNDIISAVVSSPAARRVEELHVEVDHWDKRPLAFASLPSESLRVLHAVNCSLLAAAPPASFPLLAELHLRKCAVPVADLQPIADAAPQLATLNLESCFLSEENGKDFQWPPVQPDYRLVFPVVTDIVLTNCWFNSDELSLELDVPRLQSFRYKGPIQLKTRFSLKPLPNIIIQVVDLHLTYKPRVVGGQRCIPLAFWPFIQNFRAAKLLKLKLDFFMDCLATDMYKCSALFDNLERLELDAEYRPQSEASAVVLASLLHGCPAVRDIRLRLNKDLMARVGTHYPIDLEARADFDKSVDRFRCRRRPTCLLGGDDEGNCEASDIVPAVLREQSFSFLENSLRRVSLHFCMDKPNCLGVQLAKFFTKNARVLEEINIDDGSQKLWEHVNFSV